MADSLYFDVRINDMVSKELEKIIGKANELRKALEMTKGGMAFDMKPAYDNAQKLEHALYEVDKTISHIGRAKLAVTDPDDARRLWEFQMRLGKIRAAIQRFADELKANPDKAKVSGIADSFLSEINFQEASYQANDFSNTMEKNVNKALSESTKMANGLASAYDKVSKASQTANRFQSQMLNQFNNFVSLYGVERLLKSVITIGGQFEIQHVALRNILGDVQEANVLFEQLQELAVESPMTFRQIAGYSKQLAAFSIPADELFDTTRRLADLSTGLGVDMSRLILAYGQVRSAAVLRGQELRQFTEAGIPLVQRLAEEFTKLNGKLVKTGDVFGLISKRQVPFEMVQKILWDMTNEGGQFYNMQALIAETLAGKWQKLSDVWEQALGRLAEGSTASGKALKWVMDITIGIISNLEKFAPLLAGAGLGLMGKSIFRGGVNLFTGNANKIIEDVKAAQRLNALEIEREHMLGRINRARRDELLNQNNNIKSAYTMLASTGRLNTMQLVALRLKKQITAEDLKQMVAEKAITQEQANQVMNTGRLGLLKMQLNNVFKSFFSVPNLAFMGLGAAVAYVTDFIYNLEAEAEKAKQIREEIGESANGIVKSSAEILEQVGNASSQSEMYDAIGVMSDYLKNNAASWDVIEDKMLNMKGPDVLKQKYELLKEAIEGVNKANNKMVEDPGMFEDANDVTGGWFSHREVYDMKLDEVMKETSKSLEKFRKVISSMSKDDRKNIVAIMNGLISKYKEFGQAVKDKEIENNLNKQLELLRQYPDALKDFQSNFYTKKWFGQINPSYGGVSLDMDRAYNQYAQWQNYMHQNMDEFIEHVQDRLTGIWTDIDFSKLTDEQEELVMKYAKNFLKVHQITNRDVIDDFYKYFNTKGFNLKVNLDKKKAEDELEGWQKMLDDATNKQFTTTIKAQTDIASVIEAITKMRKEAEAKLKELGPMALTFGIKFTGQKLDKNKLGLNMFDPTKQATVMALIDQINEAVDIVEGAKGAQTLGIDTTPKTKGSGSKRDKELEKAKTELDHIKKFYAEYKKYREQFGPEKGQSMVEEIFGMKQGEGTDIIKNYEQKLRGLLDNLKLNTDDRKKFAEGIRMLLGEIKLDEVKEKAKQIGEIIKNELQRESEQWSLYKYIKEKTSDKEMLRLAFSNGVMWDEQARSMESSLMSKMNQYAKDGANIELAWDVNPTVMEKYFKENFENGEQLYEIWKKIVDLIRGNYNTALKQAADANNALLTKADKIKILEDKIADARKDTTSGIDHSAEIKQWEEEIRKYKSELFELSPIYEKIFGNKYLKSYKAILKAEKAAGELIKNAKEGPVNEKTGKVDYFSSFYMDGDELKAVILTRHQLEQLKSTRDKFKKDQTELNPFKALARSAKELNSFTRNGGTTEEIEKEQVNLLNNFDAVAKKVRETTKAFRELFNVIDDGSDFQQIAEGIGQVVDTVINVVEGFKNGGEAGAILAFVGSVVEIVNNMVKQDQQNIQKSIDRVSAFKKAIDNMQSAIDKGLERSLGSIYTIRVNPIDFEELLPNQGLWDRIGIHYSEATQKAFENAKQTKSYYDASYARLLALRDQTMEQYSLEYSKKDSDEGKLKDYEKEIDELNDQIKNFAEDMAKALYDIDFKSWASQLAEALVSAWAAGESGAEAYKKKVSEILRDLGVKMITERFIAKALSPIMDEFLEQYEKDKGVLTAQGMAILAKMYDAGEEVQQQVNDFMEGIETLANQRGQSLKDSTSSSSMSSSIKGVTEQTADLLASYINAIRLDVSVNRVTLNQILLSVQGQSEMPIIARAQLQQLQQIASNTSRSANAAELIYELFHKVAPDGTAIKMR